MSLTLDWWEITIRLTLTLIAGTLIGINRGEHGRPAGLRTTLLVCLAASIAMIQTNILLGTTGRGADSFVMIDALRIPLGILSGMGFIGGGVILKRGDLVMGVTTAATLWFVTVVGLCFGGGQIMVGTIALILGLIVLWGLMFLEVRLPRDRHATLVLTVDQAGPAEETILRLIHEAGYRVAAFGTSYDRASATREYECELVWRDFPPHVVQAPLLNELPNYPGISRLRWSPQGQMVYPV